MILDQVTNGIAVRMAVLYLLAGGNPELAEAAKGSAPGERRVERPISVSRRRPGASTRCAAT